MGQVVINTTMIIAKLTRNRIGNCDSETVRTMLIFGILISLSGLQI